MSERHPRCSDCDTPLVLRSSDLAVCNQCNEYRDMTDTDLEGYL